jgi:hypothetical protein
MTPKTWTDVLIERARCEGWLRGHNGFHWEGEPLDTLSLLRPCEACHDGWMDSVGYPGYRHPCQVCDGTGIAQGGER